MKINLIAIILSAYFLIPIACLGQENTTDIKQDIAEAIFKYEIKNFAKDGPPRYNDLAYFKYTHYVISTGWHAPPNANERPDFSVNKSFLARFIDIYQPVVNTETKLPPNAFPMCIDIYRIGINNSDLAVATSSIHLPKKEHYGHWRVKYNVRKINGIWTPERLRISWQSDAG